MHNPATYGTRNLEYIETFSYQPTSGVMGHMGNSVDQAVMNQQPGIQPTQDVKSGGPHIVAAFIVAGAIGLIALMYFLPAFGIQLQF